MKARLGDRINDVELSKEGADSHRQEDATTRTPSLASSESCLWFENAEFQRREIMTSKRQALSEQIGAKGDKFDGAMITS